MVKAIPDDYKLNRIGGGGIYSAFDVLSTMHFRDLDKVIVKKEKYEYMVSFIGTAHTVRPRIVKQLSADCEKMGGKCFKYLYLPHPILFIYNKLLNPDYKKVKMEFWVLLRIC